MFAAMTLQAVLILVPAPRENETADKGPGYLGITYEQDMQGQGLTVTDVHENSPAKKAGLLVDDHLLTFGGKKIDNIQAFARQVIRLRPGTVVEAEILRGMAKKTIKIKIGVRPEDLPFPVPPPEDPSEKKEEP